MNTFPKFPEESAPEDPAMIYTKLIVRKEFLGLMDEYLEIIYQTDGCGSDMQDYIDRVWMKLQEFVKKHPEYLNQIPTTCHQCYNDGTDGLKTRMIRSSQQKNSSLHRHHHFHNHRCLIQ